MYKKIRPVLFKFDPEFIHNLVLMTGRFLGFTRLSWLLRWFFVYKNDKLKTNVMGIDFENPVGLAAGFDKNAKLTRFMPDIGFGFMEVGSVTAKACEGNPKPRLHRLVKDEGIIVHSGLANEGAEKIYERLKDRNFKIPIGVSIAKTNDSLINGKDSIEDYFESFKLLKNIGKYVTINISCPNAGDGRSFEDVKLLGALLKKIDGVRKSEKILLKLSPDIKKKNLDEILLLAKKYKINGFIVSNLTKNRKGLSADKNLKFEGGISGKHIRGKSNKLIKYIFKKTKGEFIIVGCGGIFNGADAYEKIKSGANLVQLVTGMIFEGPGVVKKINKELAELLEKDGFENVSEAVGKCN